MDIPGYYYDPEKKKYFKILPGTSNSAYSSRDVKRRKVADAELKSTQAQSSRQKGRIKKSRTLGAASAGGLLDREYGLPRRLDLTATIWADGLVEQYYVPWNRFLRSDRWHEEDNNNVLFDIRHRPEIGSSVTDFHVGSDRKLMNIRVCTEEEEELNDTDNKLQDAFDLMPPSLFLINAQQTTSVTVNQHSNHVVMTWLANEDTSGIGICTCRYDPNPSIDMENQPIYYLGPGGSRGPKVSIYSSTAAPAQSTLSFAIGSSHGIMAIDKPSCNIRWITPRESQNRDPQANSNMPRDVFALSFLENDPTVLLSGGRRGVLNLTDLRMPVFGNTADTIQHPSSITHIKQLNDHRIIVAGLNSSLCQYDLRFRKLQTPAAASWQAKSTRKSQLSKSAYTAPWLQFDEYHNPSRVPIGFDVDVELGVVAAAQQSKSALDHGQIHLYCLKTARLLRTITPEQTIWTGKGIVEGGWVQCLKLSQGSLYFGASAFQGVARYAWADDDY